MDNALYLLIIVVVVLACVLAIRNYLSWFGRLSVIYARGNYQDPVVNIHRWRSSRSIPDFLWICIGSFFMVLISFLVFGCAAFNYLFAENVRQWESVPAKIVHLQKRPPHIPGGEPTGLVRYEYMIGGRKYCNDRARLGRSYDYSWNELSRKYSIDQPVSIYVEPANPAKSYLELPDEKDPKWLASLGLFLLFAGIAIRIWFDGYTSGAAKVRNIND